MRRAYKILLVAAVATACLAIGLSASGTESAIPADLADVSSEAQAAMEQAANRDLQLIDLTARDEVDPGLTPEACRDYVDASTGDLFMYDESQGTVRQYFSSSAINAQRPTMDARSLPADKLVGIARDEALNRLSFAIPADWKSSSDTRVTVQNADGEISQWVIEFREYIGDVALENYVRIALDPSTGDLLWLSQYRESTPIVASDVEPDISEAAAVEAVALELKVDRFDVQRCELIRWQPPDGSQAALVWDIQLVLPDGGSFIGGGTVNAKTGDVLGITTPRTPPTRP